jgi:hypothetical protein
MQHLAVFILFPTALLYMFRVLFAPLIRSSKYPDDGRKEHPKHVE